MADSDNANGGPIEEFPHGSGSRPSYAPAGEPTRPGEDFSSFDLGEDSIDTSARPVRRLDLPPLMQADPAGGADRRQPPHPSTAASGGPTPARPSPDGRSDDLGVFASVPDDVNLQVSPSAAEADHRLRGAGAMGSAFPDVDAPATTMSSVHQGAPPHPHAAPGSRPVSGGRPNLRSVGSPDHGPNGARGGFADPTTPFDERAYLDDHYAPDFDDMRGGGRRRTPLELAPPIEVEQQSRSWILPVAGLLAVAALAAGYFLFFRGGDDSSTFDVAGDDLAADLAEADADATPADQADAGGDGMTDPAAPATLSDAPLLTLEGAEAGPLEVETEYRITIQGVPDGATFLVVVDGIPQEPALEYLPSLILPEGRHTISVDITAGAQAASTNEVDVYVLAPELTATHRANLSSVSIANQGWAEALKQFDEFRAAGHENIMLSPSDPYPSLLPGYWNLYVPGFSGNADALAYCEQFGLSVPDQCFPAPFDPAGPPRDG